MTYAISREGRNLGTYSEEGLSRKLDNGDLLPTDLAFLEKEQKWVPISELPKGNEDELAHAQFQQKLETVTPRAFVTPALVALECSGLPRDGDRGFFGYPTGKRVFDSLGS